jgi:hypothetical protein
MVSIDHNNKFNIDESKPDEYHPWLNVVNSIKITKRSDKKRDNIVNFNTKKNAAGEFYSSLSPIQREILDAEYNNKQEEDK